VSPLARTMKQHTSTSDLLFSPLLYTFFLAVTKSPTHSGTKLPDRWLVFDIMVRRVIGNGDGVGVYWIARIVRRRRSKRISCLFCTCECLIKMSEVTSH
jgi:hypothetical protein